MRPEPALRALVFGLVLLLPGGAAAADLTLQQRIETQLMCYCGCANLTVRACTCGTAAAIREEIAGRLDRGETPEQVVAAFVQRHGEQIRSAPTKAGFDLLAWVMPFVVILAAGGALVWVARGWAGSSADAPAPAGGPSGDGLTERQREILSRIDREFREDR